MDASMYALMSASTAPKRVLVLRRAHTRLGALGAFQRTVSALLGFFFSLLRTGHRQSEHTRNSARASGPTNKCRQRTVDAHRRLIDICRGRLRS